MLLIQYMKYHSNLGTYPLKTIEWHLGEPVPDIPPGVRVVRFQADEIELEYIIAALKGVGE
jgi:hypothetical protein